MHHRKHNERIDSQNPIKIINRNYNNLDNFLLVSGAFGFIVKGNNIVLSANKNFSDNRAHNTLGPHMEA